MKRLILFFLTLCLFILLCSCTQNMPDGLPKTSEPEYTGDSIDPHIIKISEAVKEGYISAANERPQQKPLEYIDYTASQAEQTIEAASENEENSREPADTSSCNKYLIKVNRLANCVTVYTYDDYGDYTVPVRAIVCSCGGEKTPLGTFSISDKYTWGFLMGGVWGQYCSRVVQGILFHSVPYSKASPDSVITEEYNKLGTTASHGCIRLPARDAKWIFDNCKAGTEVVIYDDTDPGPLGKPKPIRIPDGCGWDPMDDNLDNPWHRGELTFSIEGALKTEKGQRPDYLRGVCAIDPCGNDISSSVTWSTEVNYMETGSFSVIYSVSDALGSTRLLKRQLTICEAGTLSHYNHDAAQAIVDAAAAEFHTMGLSVAVIENGQVIDSLVNGYAVANSVKMSADTKMRIASISKLGVAIAAAKLYDEGLVKPDEDISTYWGKKIRNPHFPDTPITLRDILCHTSSMTSNDEDYVLGAENTLNQLLSGEVFSWVEPGAQSSYMYNNYAFGVLAVTLELAKNEVLDIYLRDTIFKQLDIEASYSTSTLDSKDLAELYDADWSVTRSIYHMITRPDRSDLGGHIWYYAGNLTISAKDLAKLVTVLINDGRYNNTEILSPEAVAWLEEPQFTVIEDDRYEFIQCLPLRYKSGLYGRDGLYYHTGTAYGVFAIVCYDPDARDGIVVLSTGASTDYDDMGIASVCGSLAESLLNLTK